MSRVGAPPDSATFPVVVDNRFVLDYDSAFRRVIDFQRFFKIGISIKDDQEQRLFRVHGYRKRRQYLHDAEDQPLLCVEKESVGFHDTLMARFRWKAYSGDGSGENRVFFHCKQVERKLFHVFLPTNTSNETMPDFVIRGRDGLKFTVHYNDHLVAETKREGETKFSFKVRKIYTTVFSGVDQAFIAAILLLMEAEIMESSGGGGGRRVARGARGGGGEGGGCGGGGRSGGGD